jgi:hypothetical protein
MESIDALRAWFEASRELFDCVIRELETAGQLPSDTAPPSAIAFEVAMAALRHGVACPDWAAAEVTRCWARYENYQVESISEAFQMPVNKHMAAKRSRLLCAAIARRVYQLTAAGVPLKESRTGPGALARVGTEFNISASTVANRVAEWEALCSDCGADPKQREPLADAEAMVRDAFAAGFAIADPERNPD